MKQHRRTLVGQSFVKSEQFNKLSPLGWWMNWLLVKAVKTWYEPVLLPFVVIGIGLLIIPESLVIGGLTLSLSLLLPKMAVSMLALVLLGLLAGFLAGGWGGGILGGVWGALPLVAVTYFPAPGMNPLLYINSDTESSLPGLTLVLGWTLASVLGLLAGFVWQWLSTKLAKEKLSLRQVLIQAFWLFFLSFTGLAISILLSGVITFSFIAIFGLLLGPM